MALSDRIAKYLLIGSVSVAVCGGSFLYGVVAYWKDFPPVPFMKLVWITLNSGDLFYAFSSDVRHHLQPTRGQGDGVTTNLVDDDAMVFMVGFFDGENQARLVDRKGAVLHKWSLDYLEHFPEKEQRICDVNTALGVDTHGALLTEKGELIFNYEYCGTVKLDQCGRVAWTISDDTHHSLTRAEDGGYWLLGRHAWFSSEAPDRFPPFSSTTNKNSEIAEDTIVRISEDGAILEEVSIPVLMRDGGLLSLLTATGRGFAYNHDTDYALVHANKLTELPTSLAEAFPLFDAGDLAISMRDHNLIVVFDGKTRAVKWHQVGPWLRQHDPEFRPDGRISVFNNNAFRVGYPNDQTDLEMPFTSNIILIDPVTRESEIRFGERPGQEMLSFIRGQHEILPDDGMIIAEFDAGRVLEVDGTGQIVWEFVNRYDDSFVGEIRNANVYPKSYFSNGIPGTVSCENL